MLLLAGIVIGVAAMLILRALNRLDELDDQRDARALGPFDWETM